MENLNGIAELLAESLKRQDQMVSQQQEMVEQLNKLNIQTAANTRAIVTMAEKIDVVIDHEHRITKLESLFLK
jgi:type III secretion system FlhB-like substrate exporter